MRIAIFHNLPSGGAKRTLQESVKRLRADHELDVYTLSAAEHDFADLRPYVDRHTVFDFRPFPLFSSPFGRLNQAFRLADLLRVGRLTRQIARHVEAGHYDLALVHPCQVEKASSILHHLNETPAIYYCQEPLRLLYENMPERPYERTESRLRALLDRADPLPSLYYGALKRVDRRNTRSASRVLVNSQFMRESVRSIYDVDAQVSYHGVDTEQFRPLATDKQPFVLSVGSLTPLKGFDFLLEAIAHIPQEDRPPLVVASNFANPPEKLFLQRLAEQLGVDLRLLGNVDDQRLVELYNQARVVVYAPVREPFGLVALEAMACATPVIAVREGGTQETVRHEETGLLVQRDPQLFAQAIAALMADPGLAARFGRNGRDYVLQQWTWNRAVERLEANLLDAAQQYESVGGRVATAGLEPSTLQ